MENTVKTSFDVPTAPAPRRYSLNGSTMGTRYTAVFYAAGELNGPAIGASLFAAVDEVDRQMSSWKPDSDLCRLNAAPENSWITIPVGLVEVLEAGMLVGRASGGAFDIGLGELVDAWGFGPSGQASAEALRAQQAKPTVMGVERLELDRAGQRVRKLGPVRLELSGIAKGYGVDRLAQCLERWHITDYLVGIDGEMRARGSKPGGRCWSVAVEKPSYHVREVAGVMELVDSAMATSGDYRRWIDIGGKRYAHTMNPTTQRPVDNELASVTVLAPSCMLADAWATALLVLGFRQGSSLARDLGMDALFVLRDAGQLREVWVDAAVGATQK